jgi:hypothetical protein
VAGREIPQEKWISWLGKSPNITRGISSLAMFDYQKPIGLRE